MKRVLSLLLPVLLLILPLWGCRPDAGQDELLQDAMALQGTEGDAPLHARSGAAGTAPEAEGEESEAPDVLALYTPAPTPTPQLPTPSPTPELPPYTVQALEEEKGYVAASGVNLRSGPHTDYESLSVLDNHAPLTVTGKSENWYQVQCAELTGFLREDFVAFGPIPTPKVTPKPFEVTKMSSTTAYVNAGTVNFRAGPGRSYDTLAEADRYDKVTITGTSGDWYRVKYNKKTGYMLKSYVKIGISPKNYKSVGKYSSADVLLLSQICYLESARGSGDGYKAVASVILNRVKSGKFPNSIERVVFQGKGAQFSPAGNEVKLRMTKPSDACVKAVSEILEGGSILPANVMYFRTASKGTSWGSTRVYYETYGGNCFFS